MPFPTRLFVANLPSDEDVEGLKVGAPGSMLASPSSAADSQHRAVPAQPRIADGSGFSAHERAVAAKACAHCRDQASLPTRHMTARARAQRWLSAHQHQMLMRGGCMQDHFTSCGHVLDAVIVYDEASASPLPLARPSLLLTASLDEPTLHRL